MVVVEELTAAENGAADCRSKRIKSRERRRKQSSGSADTSRLSVEGHSPKVRGSKTKTKKKNREETNGSGERSTMRRAITGSELPSGEDPSVVASQSGEGLAQLDADDFMSSGFMDAFAGDKDNGSRDDADDGDSSDEEDGEGHLENGNAAKEPDSEDSDDEEANAKAMNLKGLAETDPEFFNFLQKEEPDLLDFDPMDTEASEGEEESSGRGQALLADSATSLLRKASSGGVTVTMPLLKAMSVEAFERRSVKGVKRIIKAFRCACHLGDDSKEADKGQQKFHIPSSEVYNELMVTTLEDLQPAVLAILFPTLQEKPSTNGGPPDSPIGGGNQSVTPGGNASEVSGATGRKRNKKRGGREEGSVDQAARKRTRKDDGASSVVAGDKVADDGGGGFPPTGIGGKGSRGGRRDTRKRLKGAMTAKPLVLTKDDFRKAAMLPAWKALQPALYSFLKSLLHVLNELRDRTLLAFVLSSLERYVPFLVPFPGLARAFLKALLELWGGTGAETKGSEEDGEEAERVRVLAYLRVRQMAAAMPFPFVEACMKGLYLAFAKRARAPPATQAGKVSLRVMEGCVVELYGMDVGSAYQNAFLYIRQLSLLLRRAMQQKTKDSAQAVRRWQVVTCLRVWTGILAAAPAENQLKMLIYPLTQVIGGIVRLSGTLRHAPLLLQLVRMRQRLAAAAELYIPCSQPLLQVLRSPALFKKAAASTDAPPNVPGILRLGKSQVNEGRAQGAVVEETLRVLGQEMDLYRHSVAFPELVTPVLGQLRKFAKTTKVLKWRMMTRGLMDTLVARGSWAAARRVQLELEPSGVFGIEALRPKGVSTMRERLGASEAAVERIDDDDAATGAAGGAATSKGARRPIRGRSEGADAGASSSENEREDDDDSSNGDEYPADARKKPSSVTEARGGSDAGPPATSRDAEDQQSAPDLVEDLGKWSDDEWA